MSRSIATVILEQDVNFVSGGSQIPVCNRKCQNINPRFKNKKDCINWKSLVNHGIFKDTYKSVCLKRVLS